MKQFSKAIMVAAMFAGAGSANAALFADAQGAPHTGNSELFLQVYNPNAINEDGTLGLTFNLELNISRNQVVADAATAFGSGYNLAALANANWTAFASKIVNPADVKWVVAAGGIEGGIVTGNTAVEANPNDFTVLPQQIANRANEHAREINIGLGSSNSSLVQDVPSTPFTGQFDHPLNGLPINTTWAAWGHDPSVSYGSEAGLYLAEAIYRTYEDDFGDITTNLTFRQEDVKLLGNLSLIGNVLSFAPVTAVPLPAAVWMFGAGLMGVLRATRRKSVA